MSCLLALNGAVGLDIPLCHSLPVTSLDVIWRDISLAHILAVIVGFLNLETLLLALLLHN